MPPCPDHGRSPDRAQRIRQWSDAKLRNDRLPGARTERATPCGVISQVAQPCDSVSLIRFAQTAPAISCSNVTRIARRDDIDENPPARRWCGP